VTKSKKAGSTPCSPRFSTARDENRPTLGPAVGEVSRRLLRPLMPWQQHVIDVALELDEDGSYHYDELVLTVPRQSGKTSLVMAAAVHRLVVMPRSLGRQRLTYTAQQRQKARLKLERDFSEILRDAPSFKEITHIRGKPQRPTEWKLSLNNGAENIQFGRGNYLQIDAPSRTGGHGDTLDVGVIDEAFAHQDDTIESGMSPSMTTRASRQLIVLSTAGDARSFYLWRKVLAGRKACATNDHGRTAFFDWSAADDADPASPATWASCMPALGITQSLRAIEGEWEKARRDGQEGIDKFRRAYLNQWPEIPVLVEDTGAKALAMDVWLSFKDPDAERGRRPVFGVDVGADRLAHIAVVWRRPDGRVQVMLADTGLSPLRAPARVAELAGRWKSPVMLGGTSASLEADIPKADMVSGSAFAAACGRFDDLLRDGNLRHGNQPELNAAVGAAVWKASGQSGERTIELRDAPQVGPLAAVIRALHGLLVKPPAAPPAPPLSLRAPAVRSETADLRSLSF
jgi:phage terminase large subunit-like protein